MNQRKPYSAVIRTQKQSCSAIKPLQLFKPKP